MSAADVSTHIRIVIIAKRLLAEGMSAERVAKITDLKLDKVKSLKQNK